MSRIAVTGAGIISAIGLGKEETLRSLLGGRSGVGPLHYLECNLDVPCGEVGKSDSELRRILGVKDSVPLSRTSLLGIYAVREALGQAGISGRTDDRIMLASGTTVGGMDVTERIYREAKASEDSNDLLRLHTCGSTTMAIADCFGIFSSVSTSSTACSSGVNSIILAADLLRIGKCDIAVAGATECLTSYHLNGFNSLMIVDGERCRPFDASRRGLNLGEGAGFLVLETEEHAKARNVRPIAFLDGYGNACDAFHQTASSPDGEGAYRAMAQAIAMAGLKPEDIDYINAHGTGTENNDASESAAMKRLFGDRIPPVSSTKPFTGHTTSAAGGIESVICLLAMQNGFIPANLGWETPAEGCIIPEKECHQGVTLSHVLCNSFAFGGNDSSLLFSGK